MARRSRFLISVGVALGSLTAPRAQMHHVEKTEKVTRAVGVYEWTGDLAKPTASRFVPVSLFIDGHFEDAGLYLARPVPFALQDGYAYTVERSGEPEGVLDLESAARIVTGKALADDNPTGAWYGYGKYTAESAPPPPRALRRSAHLGTIQSSGAPAATTTETAGDRDDGKPHMSRRSPATTGNRPDSSDSEASSGSQSQKPGETDGEDTDRPTLARRDPSRDASRRKPAVGGARTNTASVTAVGPQPGDDPDRPTLSRNTQAEEGPQQMTGMPAGLHQAVAVSDAVSREPHPFARPWSDGEERAAVLTAMAALARTRLVSYLSENNLVPSSVTAPAATRVTDATGGTGAAAGNGSTGVATGTGAPPKLQRGKPMEYTGGPDTGNTAHERAAPPARARNVAPGRGMTARKGPGKGETKPVPAAPLSLQQEELSGYTLSYGGLPTFIFSASAPVTSKDNKGSAAPFSAFITLVAQRLPSGELQVALTAVTDSQHLDRSPQLQLVDAVDPDASHRASLLFQLREANSRQFALYRLTTARAENTFTTAAKE